jgi:hypothetical protein
VLSCSAIAPEFLHVIGQTLLGASIAWTGAGVQHTLRGVSLEIRGDVSGPTEVDGETLREWLARGFRPAPFAEPPPFTLEVVPGNAAITLQTKAGVAQATPRRGPAAADRCAAYLAAWLAMQPYWRPRSGASPIIGLSAEATASSPNTFVLKGFDVQTQRSARGFPFELDAPRALLANALTALHAEVPLERVVWQTGSHVPS